MYNYSFDYITSDKDAVVTRYYDVEIKDLRDDEVETRHLYGLEFKSEVKDYTLDSDPVWKETKAKLQKLGYEITGKPRRVERLKTRISLSDYFWSLDYEEEQARQKAEAEAEAQA